MSTVNYSVNCRRNERKTRRQVRNCALLLCNFLIADRYDIMAPKDDIPLFFYDCWCYYPIGVIHFLKSTQMSGGLHSFLWALHALQTDRQTTDKQV